MHRPILLALVLVAAALPRARAQSITTLFQSNGGGATGGAVYFDVRITHASGLKIWSFDVSAGNAPAGTPITLDVYTTPTTSVGKETNRSAWTKVATGSGTAQGFDVPAPVDTGDFRLAPGSYGFALAIGGAGFRYTNGNGSNQSYSNADIRLDLGTASSVPFVGTVFRPRVWNGTIYYTAPGIWTTTYGVFGSGCPGSVGVPTLAATPGSLPRLGGTISVDLANLPLNGTFAVMLIGASKTTWGGRLLPFDLGVVGMTGCELFCNVIVAETVGNVAGQANWTATVPGCPCLLGATFYNQALVEDPGFNPFGAVMTNAAEACIGN